MKAYVHPISQALYLHPISQANYKGCFMLNTFRQHTQCIVNKKSNATDTHCIVYGKVMQHYIIFKLLEICSTHNICVAKVENIARQI